MMRANLPGLAIGALGLIVTTALLAAPSPTPAHTLPLQRAGAGAPLPHVTYFGTERVDRSSVLVYVSDQNPNQPGVFIFSKRTGKEIAAITGFLPGAVAVDAAENLYVADEIFDRVIVYPRGTIQPSAILEDPGQLPYGIAVAHDGTIWVANACGTANGCTGPSSPGAIGNPGNVVAYAPGNTRPTKVITSKVVTGPSFISLNSANQIVVSGVGTASSGQVVGVLDLNGNFTPLSGVLPNRPLRFDAAGRLAVLNSGVVLIYDFPSGTLARRVRLDPEYVPRRDLTDFAFSADGDGLWSSVYFPPPSGGVPGFSGAIQFSVPGGRSGAAFQDEYGQGMPFWVAVSPALVP